MENHVLNDGHSYHIDMPNYLLSFQNSIPFSHQNNSVYFTTLPPTHQQFVVAIN